VASTCPFVYTSYFQPGQNVQLGGFHLSIPIRVSLPARSLPEERGSAQTASLLVYIIKDKAANLWMQPLDGSPGHQITNFTADLITGFRWSPDRKTLAVMRTHSTSDNF
jgi:hypothetical protein